VSEAEDGPSLSPLPSADPGNFPGGREDALAFGPYRLYPARQFLLHGEKPLRLGSRAMSLLIVLVERAGELVTKEELIEKAWPETYVEEVNLRVHVAAIRRALADNRHEPAYIANIAGRGYRFVAEVRKSLAAPASPGIEPAVLPTRRHGLPTPLTRIIGRDDVISSIVSLLDQWRLVSIVGAGGIGKTSVALIAANRLQDRFADSAFFVDLAAVSDPMMVPFAVAAALAVSIETESPIPSLIAQCRHKRMLVVLDNCEHVIDASAAIAESLLKGAPGVRILTTSHEPLRAEGEWMYRLVPLRLPDDVDDMTLEDAMGFPAIELFVERARTDDDMLVLRDADVPFIAEICRKLDGIPLAIEIAAARAEVLGIAELAARLDDRFKLLTGGRRTAVARHQTMRSMLDWSHENLTDLEKTVLRRLSIFAGAFNLEAAGMVTGDDRVNPFVITEAIASLVRKSLLFPGTGPGRVTYRLLDSTRLYALEKLEAAGEVPRLRRLHAQFLCDLLARAETDWNDTPRNTWLENYGVMLDDIRASIAWAFGENGDPAPGVVLTSLAMPLGLQMGLTDEFRERAETALTLARNLTPPELVAEMRLNIVYGVLNQNQVQPSNNNLAGLARATQIADRIGQDKYRIEPLIVLGSFNMSMGNFRTAITHAEHAGELGHACREDLAVLAANRILAQSTHFVGEHRRSGELAISVLNHPVLHIPLAYGNVQTDRRVSMRIILGRVLWMEGFADQAAAVLEEAVEIAPEDGPMALLQAISLGAAQVLLWRGDDRRARELTTLLIEQASRFTMGVWLSWGKLFEAVLDQRSSGAGDIPIIATGELQRQALATFNGNMTGLEIVPGDRGGEQNWCAPELLRLRGEELIAKGETTAGETLLLRGLDLAQRQGALAWELRAATSMARHWAASPRHREALDRLKRIYGRFTEGFATTDLVAARQLIDRLSRQ
jgi:predicted ATPase/DNA-binding winged helix-turn-helix (wHTH) protein